MQAQSKLLPDPEWSWEVVHLGMFRIYRHMRLCTTVYLQGARWFCVVCPLMPMVRSLC